MPSASGDTNWEAVTLDPAELAQMESEGQPVLANTYFAVRHASTQANLLSDEQTVSRT